MTILKNRKGFTIIELFVTLALLGILLAIALPRISVPAGWKLEGAARKLAVDLRLARNESVTSGKICQVKFFPDFVSCVPF